MISEQLKSDAIAFLNGVIAESNTDGKTEGLSIGYESGYTAGYNKGVSQGKTSGYTSGYTVGKTEGYNSGYTVGVESGKTIGYNNGYAVGVESGKTIGYNSGYTIGYEEGINQSHPDTPVEPSGDTPSSGDTPTPSGDTPSSGDTPQDGYSTEKAVANLDALKGEKSYVFAILDDNANAYGTVADWQNAGSPTVLGIGFASGSTHLCMHIKKLSSRAFGGDGIKFNTKKVFTSTDQWKTVYTNMTGVANTDGIIAECNDSCAAACKNVVFANGKNGYMPAQGEIRIICKYFAKADELLVGVGGDKLKTQNGAQVLWSSTCRDANTAWSVRFMSEGDSQPKYYTKTSKLACRVFVEL